MKSVRNVGKLFGVLTGILGIAAFSSSCNKERDCACTYTYAGFDFEFDAKVKGKCETLEFRYDGEDFDINCEEK